MLYYVLKLNYIVIMDTQQHNIIQDITADDITEIEKEPGDISDIIQDIPDKEKLDKLKSMIDSMPRNDIIQLLSQLGDVNDMNTINPNENKFSTITQKEMRRRKYKMMIDRKKQERLPIYAKKKMQENIDKKSQDTYQQVELDGTIIDVDDEDNKKFTINGVD